MYRTIVALYWIFFAFGSAYSATAINLEVDVVDKERYGNKHPSPVTKITDELQASFFLKAGGQTSLSVVGYDIDFPDEVSITVNDGDIMFLDTAKVNNGYSPAALINLGNLSTGNHTLIIKNAINKDYKWGVTDLLIAQEDGGGGGSGHAFELLAELDCEVGQLIRATALGWECVDEYNCPESVVDIISNVLDNDPVVELNVDQVCIVDGTSSGGYAVNINVPDDWFANQMFLSAPFFGDSPFTYTFHHLGEFQSCANYFTGYCTQLLGEE